MLNDICVSIFPSYWKGTPNSAFETLKSFGVQKEEMFELVQQHIKEIAKGVNKALGKRRGLHTV
jgi:hypothetical protein